MPSQLLTNEAISFVAAKDFTYGDHRYAMGDDFPQEDANNIETMVRSRYLIPVVDDLSDKPRHWHRHVGLRQDVLDRLFRDKTQIVLPEQAPVPVTAAEAAETESSAVPSGAGVEAVPEGTANEVLDWVGDDPARAQQALAAEQARDKPRSTLIAKLEAVT